MRENLTVVQRVGPLGDLHAGGDLSDRAGVEGRVDDLPRFLDRLAMRMLVIISAWSVWHGFYSGCGIAAYCSLRASASQADWVP
jgi:hypothetical protein